MVDRVIVALDVAYEGAADETVGRCGVVVFAEWTSREPSIEMAIEVTGVKPYVSGRLVERELPCLVAGLEALVAGQPDIDVETVLVDGNVRLDNEERAGLGLYLYRHLGEAIPVIGVAKNPFAGLDAVEVLRGSSGRPLYVTSAGIDENDAAALVASMAGRFRIPTLIRRADQLTRTR